MPQSRQARDSALTLRLIVASVLLGVALAAAWPAASPAGAATTTTFLYTGAQQTFVVPAAVTNVHVLAVGGRGGNGLAPGGGAGGAAAEVSGDLEVFPGQTLYVEVGGVGAEASSETIARAFNGGTFGGQETAGGGGASDVRLRSRPEPDTPDSLFSRLIVAGGGGGGGEGLKGTSGGAGGQAGSAGESANGGVGGGAGTEEAGGSSPCGKGCEGKLGSGGSGTVGLTGSGGGGGGGGLFGGAGGTSNGTDTGAGAGGGSSLQPQGGKTVIPAVAARPEVQISYTPPAPPEEPRKPTPVPSNAFTLLRPIVGVNRSITLVLDPAGAGTITASATSIREVLVSKHGRRIHRKVRFTFGTARATVTAAGALELTIKPSAAGRKALAAHRRLPVAIAVTFAPTGGKTAAQKTGLTLPRR